MYEGPEDVYPEVEEMPSEEDQDPEHAPHDRAEKYPSDDVHCKGYACGGEGECQQPCIGEA